MSAQALVVNLDDASRYSQVVELVDGQVTVQVPVGHYSVVGEVADWSPGATRDALAGTAQVTVTGPTTVLLDGAAARPVTASVSGVATTPSTVALIADQQDARGVVWEQAVYGFGEDAGRWPLWSTPISGADIGSFQPYQAFTLVQPGSEPSPYLYDLLRALPGAVPADPTYQVSTAEQRGLARITQHFNRPDLPAGRYSSTRYGLTAAGFLAVEDDITEPAAIRTDYVTPGVTWLDEAFDRTVFEFGLITEEGERSYLPGSVQDKTWWGQPLRPDWYDDPAELPSVCAPTPIRRTSGHLHVELVDLTDQHQRFNCLRDDQVLASQTTRTLTLYRNGRQVGQQDGPIGEFDIPAPAATYRLRYDMDASGLLPVSTRVSTEWTFRSVGPSGTDSVPVPLLSLDYGLPLDAANHPAGRRATFTVRQASGVPAQEIDHFAVWTSTDDGRTWLRTPAVRVGADTFAADLPVLAAGQALSLRVAAHSAAGSRIVQTIIRAYRTA